MTREIVVAVDATGMLSLRERGVGSADGVAWQVLPVAGGVIEIDVRAPERGMMATIDDAAAASWWVPFVFGEPAAAALAELDASTTEPSRVVVPARVEPDTSLDTVARRLLVGFWLRRWWPAGLADARVSEWLMDAELGTLAAEAEVLFGTEEIAAALLTGHLPTLVAEAEAALAGTTTGADRVEVVQRAVLAAADVVHEDVEGFDGIEEAASRIRAVGGLSAPPDDVDGLVTADPTAVPSDATGAPVDWTSVHPRQLSPFSDAIRHTIREGGDATVVDVTVDAPPEFVSVPVAPGELYARIGLDDEVEAVALAADGARFSGSVVIPRSHRIEVTVYSDVYGVGGRDAPDASAVDRVRAEVLEIVSGRLRLRPRPDIVVAPFAFERQFVRDARRSAEIEETVRAALLGADVDLDAELLTLTESSGAMRSSLDDGATDEFRVETDDMRLDLFRHDAAWRVRVTLFGEEGVFDVEVVFASGATRSVRLAPAEGDWAEADVAVDDREDLPVRVRVRRLP